MFDKYSCNLWPDIFGISGTGETSCISVEIGINCRLRDSRNLCVIACVGGNNKREMDLSAVRVNK